MKRWHDTATAPDVSGGPARCEYRAVMYCHAAPRPNVSQISWRSNVARQPTEDTDTVAWVRLIVDGLASGDA